MKNDFQTRILARADLPAVSTILDETGLFPSDLLAAMAAPFLVGSADHLWTVICAREAVLGFAYSEPERMTDNTHTLLAIAISPGRQREGVGTALVHAVEQQLRHAGGRILIVETSSLDAYAGTRAFYDGQHFTREARLRDFYADGEDKIVFWKKL